MQHTLELNTATTTIESNGSKWAGQQPDSLEVLYGRLATYTLDPTFEQYGDFLYQVDGEPGLWHGFGNFLEVSGVFNLTTDDPGVIARLRALIDANKTRPEYAPALAAIEAQRRAEAEWWAQRTTKKRPAGFTR